MIGVLEHRGGALAIPPLHQQGTGLFFGFVGDFEHRCLAFIKDGQQVAAVGDDWLAVGGQLPVLQVRFKHSASQGRPVLSI
ncbi:hypothetical protein D3C84_1034120 [compost metagenome]